MGQPRLTPRVVVAGAGPAGSAAAIALCERHGSRYEVVLADGRTRDEKPCGGGVTWRGQRAFEEWLRGVPHREIFTARVRLDDAPEVEVPLSRPLAIFARSALDSALVARARAVGARVVAGRVRDLEARPNGFACAAGDEAIEGGFLVAADGAGSPTARRLEALGRLPPRDETCDATSLSTYLHGRADSAIRLGFKRGVDGYAWSFPRIDHVEVGVCVERGKSAVGTLDSWLDEVLDAWFGGHDRSAETHRVGALIPGHSMSTHVAVEGEHCARVGDAAGAVDPITREGIAFALESGRLLGESDPIANPGAYAAAFERSIAPELAHASRLRRVFFDPRFQSATLGMLAASGRLREIFADLVAGVQRYSTLRRRLLRTAPWILPKWGMAALRQRRAAPSR